MHDGDDRRPLGLVTDRLHRPVVDRRHGAQQSSGNPPLSTGKAQQASPGCAAALEQGRERGEVHVEDVLVARTGACCLVFAVAQRTVIVPDPVEGAYYSAKDGQAIWKHIELM